MRVVLADSNPRITEMLRACCEMIEGVHSVDVALDAVDALHRAILTHADVVVVEIDHPVLDGLSLLRIMRRSCYTARIISTSSAANAHLAAQATRAGSAVHLVKPFPLEEFFRAVSSGPVRLRNRGCPEVGATPGRYRARCLPVAAPSAWLPGGTHYTPSNSTRW